MMNLFRKVCIFSRFETSERDSGKAKAKRARNEKTATTIYVLKLHSYFKMASVCDDDAVFYWFFSRLFRDVLRDVFSRQ